MIHHTFNPGEGLSTSTEFAQRISDGLHNIGRLLLETVGASPDHSQTIALHSGTVAIEGMTVATNPDDKSEGNGDDPGHDGKLLGEEDKTTDKFEPRDPKERDKN